MAELRLPDVHPGSFSCPYLPGTKSSGSLAFPSGSAWVSQVPGFPLCMRAPVSDPGGYQWATAARPTDCCFPAEGLRQLPQSHNFRGSI